MYGKDFQSKLKNYNYCKFYTMHTSVVCNNALSILSWLFAASN